LDPLGYSFRLDVKWKSALRCIAVGLYALLIVLCASAAEAQVGALQTDCRLGGKRGDSYQFVATCAGSAPSPDRHFAVVQHPYRDTQPPIELQDAQGRTIVRLRSLSDDMPFSVWWSPNSRWFFVNHHVGSFMDTLQVFEVKGRSAIERPALGRAAVRLATRRYPCLRPQMVYPNGLRWSRDGRRLIIVTISATYACQEFARHPGRWQSLWMIGDVQSGRLDGNSIRVQPDEGPLAPPRGGPYGGF